MTNTNSYPPINFSWLEKDKLAVMGHPSTSQNIRWMEEHGIRHLITLSPERTPCLEGVQNLTWKEIPIEEFEAPTLEQIITFIEICQRAVSREEAVGIHCRQGMGRSGVMAACYLVKFHRFSPEDAISKVRELRPGSIETEEQEYIIYDYYNYNLGKPVMASTYSAVGYI